MTVELDTLQQILYQRPCDADAERVLRDLRQLVARHRACEEAAPMVEQLYCDHYGRPGALRLPTGWLGKAARTLVVPIAVLESAVYLAEGERTRICCGGREWVVHVSHEVLCEAMGWRPKLAPLPIIIKMTAAQEAALKARPVAITHGGP